MPDYTGFKEALEAIQQGKAVAHALWVLIGEEKQREDRALKPMPWEGPGEYQHVWYEDGRWGLVRLPTCESLPCTRYADTPWRRRD